MHFAPEINTVIIIFSIFVLHLGIVTMFNTDVLRRLKKVIWEKSFFGSLLSTAIRNLLFRSTLYVSNVCAVVFIDGMQC